MTKKNTETKKLTANWGAARLFWSRETATAVATRTLATGIGRQIKVVRDGSCFAIKVIDGKGTRWAK